MDTIKSINMGAVERTTKWFEEIINGYRPKQDNSNIVRSFKEQLIDRLSRQNK